MQESRFTFGYKTSVLLAAVLVACGGQPEAQKPSGEFSFTEDDVARFREMVEKSKEESGTGVIRTGTAAVLADSGSSLPAPKVDLSVLPLYESLRESTSSGDSDAYRVTNAFLNVRKEPKVTSPEVARLTQGQHLSVVDFPSGAWAKVRLKDGTEGFVSLRYIAKLVSEERLAEEKKAFDGMYFVDFGFLNVRKGPDSESEKIGELPGQTIVRPLSIDDVWARVLFDGKEGYVASEYLSPFLPAFLVRQEEYRLPMLRYRADQPEILAELPSHIAALKAQGYSFITMQKFKDVLVEQQQGDVRLPPRSVVLAITDVTADTLNAVSDTLRQAGVTATVFIPTNRLGIDGITEKNIVTLMANGFDVQSGAHSGDDLRSLSNAQVELELKQSRALLEEFTGRTVFAVAYPMGGVNERIMQKAAEAGYLFGIGSVPSTLISRSDFLQIPSFSIGLGMTGDQVVTLIKE